MPQEKRKDVSSSKNVECSSGRLCAREKRLPTAVGRKKGERRGAVRKKAPCLHAGVTVEREKKKKKDRPAELRGGGGKKKKEGKTLNAKAVRRRHLDKGKKSPTLLFVGGGGGKGGSLNRAKSTPSARSPAKGKKKRGESPPRHPKNPGSGRRAGCQPGSAEKEREETRPTWRGPQGEGGGESARLELPCLRPVR